MNQRIFYNIKTKYPYINSYKLNILPSAIMDIPFTIKIQCGSTVIHSFVSDASALLNINSNVDQL